MPQLTDSLQPILAPLFEALPLDEAMSRLVGPANDRGSADHRNLVQLVEVAAASPELQAHPAVVAGLWLYIDELDRSHSVSQDIETPTGSFWHAIMHRREGDFSNSKYWYRRVGHHPATGSIGMGGGGAGSGTTVGGYDPYAFVDAVEHAHTHGDASHPELVAMQRREWKGLFEWCMEH